MEWNCTEVDLISLERVAKCLGAGKNIKKHLSTHDALCTIVMAVSECR